ncbi:putative outer membrane starch-binding protein [Chitinophaga dinghuensis]|uniref:Putative outer membrane starch-binding protein n=2 Tax=Chitinophaga dinghuensis TaxID=1539050 RepID=A0A327W4P4_9BACT|nr:putative outer membrane starch-binding protein [Chitinophaga dinghuensis]
MMKKNISIIFLAAAMGLGACKKSLDETPRGFLTPDNAFQDASDAQTAVNGMLSQLQPQAYYQRTIYIITECSTDGLMPITGQTPERTEMYNLTYTAGNAEIKNWWQNSYKLISRANDIIANVPKISMDDTQKKNLLGNAYFLRGMAYFDLVRSFGDVPLLLTTVTGINDPNIRPTRTAAATVYKQVIADLQYAESNCFPENKITLKGMVSSGAASAMLARVYLQRNSTAWKESTDNQNALDECNKVIGSGLYKLLPNYQDIFDCDKKNGPEHIFSVQFGSNGTGTTQNIIVRMFSPAGLGGSGSFLASPLFYTQGYYGTEDVRRTWNLSNSDGTATPVAPYVAKYRDPQWVKGSNNARNNWIVLRYADVLLMQSEAMNNLDPSNVAKFNGLNQVRQRAGLTAASYQLNLSNTPTPDAFVDTLVKDRARELFVEGHRRWDLIRLGRYKQVEQQLGNTLQDYQQLFPLPQSELDANPNLKQNPLYP